MMTQLLSWMVLFLWMLYTLHVFRFHGAESEKKLTDVQGLSIPFDIDSDRKRFDHDIDL